MAEESGWSGYSLLNLDVCLRPRKGRPIPGAPPQHLQDVGVACFSADDLRRMGCHLGQFVILRSAEDSDPDSDVIERMRSLSIKERLCVASAWPLTSVPNGFVALPEVSHASLGLSYLQRGPPKASSASTNSASKNRRRSSSNKSRNSIEPPKVENYVQVEILVIAEDHLLRATEVTLDSNLPLDTTTLADVKDKLRGLMVSKGSVIRTSFCGEPLQTEVSRLLIQSDPSYDCSSSLASVGKVTRDTLFLNKSWRSDESGATYSQRDTPKQLRVGGLEKEAKLIRDLLWASGVISSPDSNYSDDAEKAGILRPRGVLLYGPPGTGKSSLAMMIAGQSKANIELVNSAELVGSLLGESEQRLNKTFRTATKKSPCVIVLDEVDAISVRRDVAGASDADIRTTTALIGCIDRLPRGVFVIGTTNRADAIDPALRRAERFDREIEIPVPSSDSRYAILKSIVDSIPEETRKIRIRFNDENIRQITDAAHGFVGADLTALWREAVRIAVTRDSGPDYHDLLLGLRATKPSALRDISVEVPHVKWDDVGGNQEAKLRLKESIEWLIGRGVAHFKQMGISPPSGILLFGPPGCSKTLLAKAVATEAGLNFLSVKGPELLSKYVGDSEKAVRSLFTRARSVAPSIIFFDELDALATSRGGGGAEDRVLAQMLVEMDGVKSSNSSAVVVIGATNRPDMIDVALLRPGRMDSLIYVSLPDLSARKEILKIHMRNQPVVSIDLQSIAEQTEGFSGAELAALVREAAIAAMEEDVVSAREVLTRHYDRALQRIQPRTSSEQLKFYDDYIARSRGVIMGHGTSRPSGP